jgi:hypothetical protein
MGDLAVQSEYYTPSIDEKGCYIDTIPSFNSLQNGIRCVCGTRKDHVFKKRQCFKLHIETEQHIKWLSKLNLDKNNFYTENIKLNEIVNSQKMIIAQLEKKLIVKSNIIDDLIIEKLKFEEEIKNRQKNCDINLINL